MPVDPQTEPKDPLPGPGFSPSPARRLTRSTSDKHVAGVAGGLGQLLRGRPDDLPGRVRRRRARQRHRHRRLHRADRVPALRRGEPAWIEGRSRVTTIAADRRARASPGSTMLAPPAFFLGPGLLGVAGRDRARAGALPRLRRQRPRGPGARDRPRHARARRARRRRSARRPASACVAALGGGPAMAAIAIFAGLVLIARRACWAGRDGSSSRSSCSCSRSPSSPPPTST